MLEAARSLSEEKIRRTGKEVHPEYLFAKYVVVDFFKLRFLSWGDVHTSL